ncbi:MAG: alpha/beta hydrolase, partial [Nitratireductor sp.]|nr:alpha/beta hydrolase [Nitratireductor sp.]
MPDYDQLLDAEMKAFVDRTNSYYPPETVTFTIDQQRAVYNRMCSEFHAGRPATVSVRDDQVPGDYRVPVRIYDKAGIGEPSAAVVYFHGGGFVVGGLESHDDVCAEICDFTDYRVVSVDYRLSPEYSHPAAFDDSVAAFDWVAGAFGGPIVVAGDSAGGNLAAAVSHARRGHSRQPAGQVLIYPGLGGDHNAGSYLEHANAPMLTKADIDFYVGIRTKGKEITGDPTLAPLHDTDYSNLPPTLAFPAECDPLCDDSANYCARITAAGGEA